MDYTKFIQPAIGAIIGFSLAQLVNLAVLIWERYTRPKLTIGEINEIPSDDPTDACSYTFSVKNTGRNIATAVQFQLIKIEYQQHEKCGFKCISEHVSTLPLYKSQGTKEYTNAVLIPGAIVDVHLASRPAFEDMGMDIIFPAGLGLPDFYDSVCEGAEKYRFTVVAFDDKAHYGQKVLTISS